MQAEADAKNGQLARAYDEIDSMLRATLNVDDHVDLETLRSLPDHPPFGRTDLEVPTSVPVPVEARPEPKYVDPEPPPKGLAGILGGKKRHAELVAKAQADYLADHAAWQDEIAALPELRARQADVYRRAEHQRLAALDHARRQYEAECSERQGAADESNRRLDELISGLDYNVDSAIQEYVSIVLGNSVYPECFPIDHDFQFDAPSKELSLIVLIPPPAHLPFEKDFRYVKAKSEVVSTALPKKDQRDRYANAVGQVALRTIHEVFEADRSGRIQTITLIVGTESVDPATGLPKQTQLLAVGADRASFMSFDLSNIVPLATLQHMNAVVSKSPFELVAIDTSKGVRGR